MGRLITRILVVAVVALSLSFAVSCAGKRKGKKKFAATKPVAVMTGTQSVGFSSPDSRVHLDVMVEQALPQGYTLVETAAPAEQAQGLARWPVTCAPGAETTFATHQRTETTRWERVRGRFVRVSPRGMAFLTRTSATRAPTPIRGRTGVRHGFADRPSDSVLVDLLYERVIFDERRPALPGEPVQQHLRHCHR